MNRQLLRRLYFFSYVTGFGCLAHLLSPQVPQVPPLLIGLIAPILLLMRLGPLWACASFLCVLLPLSDPLVWTLALSHLLLAQLRLWLGRLSRTLLPLLYLFICLLLFNWQAPNMDPSLQMFCAALQSLTWLFNLYCAHLMLELAQNAVQQRQQSLQNQLSGRIAVFSAVPAGLLGLSILYVGIVQDLSRHNLHADTIHNQMEQSIQQHLQSYIAELNFVANQLQENSNTLLIKQLVKQHPEYISALRTNASGNVVDFYKEFINNDILGNNVSFRDYYLAPKSSGKPVVTNVFQGQRMGRDLIFAVAVPLYQQQAFNGVLEVSVALERLTASMPTSDHWQNEHYLLVDGNRIKLWGTSSQSGVGKTVDLTALNLQVQRQLFSHSWFLSGSPPQISNNDEHLMQIHPIAGTDWQLIMYHDMAPLYWRYNLASFLTLLCIALVTYFVRYSSALFVSGYTTTLSQLVEQIHSLDVEQPNTIPATLLTSAKEFEILQQSYEHLKRRIHQNVRQLHQVLKEKTNLSAELELRVEQRTQELALERDKANELAKVKTQFLANMSHELRTPLTVIQGYAEQLTASKLAGDTGQKIAAIESQSGFLLQVVNDILDSAKIEEGKLRIDPQVFSLPELLTQLQAGCAPLAEHRGLSFHIIRHTDVPDWLYSDNFRVRQILLNLLSNAIKFTTEGYVKLVVRVEHAQVLFEVIDTGPGISAEQQARIFQAFEQADVSTTRQYGGTGLGLFICARLAELLGATIAMHSTVGAGSCFWLRLPLIEITEDAITQAKQQPEDEPEPQKSLQGTVLITDDVEELRRLFRSMLEPVGVTCVEAADGHQALAMLQQQPIDVMLLDMHMPKLDGMGVLQALQHQSQQPTVIALTADVQACVHNEILRLGATAVLTKPVRACLLRQTLAPFLIRTDHATAESEVMPETEEMDELQASYIESLQGLPERLQQASRAEQMNTLHKVKGTAACLELHQLSQLAASLEQAYQQHPDTEADFTALYEEVTRLLHSVKTQQLAINESDL